MHTRAKPEPIFRWFFKTHDDLVNFRPAHGLPAQQSQLGRVHLYHLAYVLEEQSSYVLIGMSPLRWGTLGSVGGAPGPQGPIGAQGRLGEGAQGAQGHDGEHGAQGKQGHQGSVGYQGQVGGTGAQGGAGAQGSQGERGVAPR